MMEDQYEVGTLEDADKFAIMRLAREAGFYKLPVDERLERFAALVAAAKLESVAEVFDHMGEFAAAEIVRGLK